MTERSTTGEADTSAPLHALGRAHRHRDELGLDRRGRRAGGQEVVGAHGRDGDGALVAGMGACRRRVELNVSSSRGSTATEVGPKPEARTCSTACRASAAATRLSPSPTMKAWPVPNMTATPAEAMPRSSAAISTSTIETPRWSCSVIRDARARRSHGRMTSLESVAKEVPGNHGAGGPRRPISRNILVIQLTYENCPQPGDGDPDSREPRGQEEEATRFGDRLVRADGVARSRA